MAGKNDLVIKIGADTKDAKTKISDLEKQLKNLGSGITRPTGTTLPSFFNGLGSSMKKLTLNTNSLAAAFGKFYASYFLVIRGAKKLMSSIKSSMGLLETVSYFNKAYDQLGARAVEEMGEAGEEAAKAYTEKFTKTSKELFNKMTGYDFSPSGKLSQTGMASLGINPNDMLNYQAQFAQIASSMGVTSEYAEKLSRALTMLGGDLTSLKNLNFKEVWGNLSSALVGQARTVDKFGANIRNAAMQEKLFELGINANISKLGQQDKALLRTIIVLEATRSGWADLAMTLDRPANQMRVLKANVESLSRTIGSVFVGALNAAIPYINALVIALRTLIENFMALFGITLPEITSQSSAGFEDLSDSLDQTDEALQSAAGSAKKLKQNLLGIDELNVISSPTDSGAGGAGGLGDASEALKAAFDKIFGEYDSIWNREFAKIQDKAQKMADKILNAVKKGDWKAIGSTIGSYLKKQLDNIPWDNVYQGAKNFGKGIADFLNGLITPELFSSIGSTIAGYINTQFYALGAFVENFDWKNAGISLAALVEGFVDDLDVVNIAKTISTGLNGAFLMIGNFLSHAPWNKIGEKIGIFLKELDWPKLLAGLGSIIIGAIVAGFRVIEGISWADPIAAVIIAGIGTSLAIDKTAILGQSILKAINSSKSLSLLVNGEYKAANGIAKGLSGKLGTAWTSLGGLKGIFTTDLKMIQAAGTMTEIGLTIGTGIIGGVAAAIAGYKLGDAIYRNLIEGTDWDAFGYDLIEKARIDEQASIVAEEIRKAESVWNASIIAVADNLQWDQMFNFEGNDVWAETINDMDAMLQQLAITGTDLSDTSSALEALDNISMDVSDTTLNLMENMIRNYNAMDATTKVALEQQYGFKNLKVAISDTSREAANHIIENGKLVSAYSKTSVASDGVKKSLSEQKVEIDNTVQKLKDYITANGGSYEACKQLYEAQQRQKEILQDTITELKNYQTQHGGNYQIAKQLYEAQKELNEATGKSKETTDKATEGYNALMESFENSTLSSADFAGYMETLSEKDVPKAVEAIKGMDETVKNLSKTLPNLKDEFEKAFKQIDTDVTNASTKLIPDFETSVDNMKINLSTTVLPELTKAFEDTAANSVTALNQIIDWYDKDFKNKFTKENVLKDIKGIEEGFSTVFGNVSKVVVNSMNKLITAINNAFDISWDAIQIDGEDVVGAGKAKLINIAPIQGFANGGYPAMGDLFYANEAGPELVGTMNGRNAVASNNEITGIRQAIYDVASEIITEMRNNETRVVLEGDAKGMFKQMRNEAKIYQRSTGSPAFNF